MENEAQINASASKRRHRFHFRLPLVVDIAVVNAVNESPIEKKKINLMIELMISDKKLSKWFEKLRQKNAEK